MNNKDLFKILLCSYGYDRNITIDNYYGDDGSIGYDIHAENKEGDCYNEVNCEGTMFHVYQILNYMKDNNVKFKSDWWYFPVKYIIKESLREECIISLDKRDEAVKKDIIRLKPLFEWRDSNNPCPTCTINKKDHWDNIHYNCELCHTHSCEILLKFQEDYNQFRKEFITKSESNE